MRPEWAAFYALRRANDLPMFVIYERPLDYPAGYIARLWSTLPSERPTEHAITADSLESLRELMPPGADPLPRDPSDEPHIVETWL